MNQEIIQKSKQVREYFNIKEENACKHCPLKSQCSLKFKKYSEITPSPSELNNISVQDLNFLLLAGYQKSIEQFGDFSDTPEGAENVEILPDDYFKPKHYEQD